MADGIVQSLFESEPARNLRESYWGYDPMEEQKLVQDGSSDAVSNWASRNNYKVSDETLDYLYKQFFEEKNANSTWQKTLEADNTKYQRMVKDMQAAGLNPFLALSGSPSGSSAPSMGSGFGSISDIKNSRRQNKSAVLNQVLQTIGTISRAVIMALMMTA